MESSPVSSGSLSLGSFFDGLPAHPMDECSPSSKPVVTYERGSMLGCMGTTFNWADCSSNEIASVCGRLIVNKTFDAFSLYLIYVFIVPIFSFCLRVLTIGMIRLPQLFLPAYLMWLILPIGLYNIIRIVCGWVVHPAALPGFVHLLQLDLEDLRRAAFVHDKENVARRMSVRVNGSLVDVVVAGKKEYAENGRYIIFSVGNGMVYETHAQEMLELANELQALALFYNYPSVGRSEGILADREATCATLVAMHKLIRTYFPTPERREKVIFDVSFSIGGGVQEGARPAIRREFPGKCVFVKIRTFSSLYECAKDHLPRLAWLVLFLNWEYPPSTRPRKRRLSNRDIVIQSGRVNAQQKEDYMRMESLQDLRTSVAQETDTVIAAGASFAHAFFPEKDSNNIQFFVAPCAHMGFQSGFLGDVKRLAAIIDASLPTDEIDAR